MIIVKVLGILLLAVMGALLIALVVVAADDKLN